MHRRRETFGGNSSFSDAARASARPHSHAAYYAVSDYLLAAFASCPLIGKGPRAGCFDPTRKELHESIMVLKMLNALQLTNY